MLTTKSPMNPSPPPMPPVHGPVIVNRKTNQIVEPLSSDLMNFVRIMQNNWVQAQQPNNTYHTNNNGLHGLGLEHDIPTTPTDTTLESSNALLSLRRSSAMSAPAELDRGAFAPTNNVAAGGGASSYFVPHTLPSSTGTHHVLQQQYLPPSTSSHPLHHHQGGGGRAAAAARTTKQPHHNHHGGLTSRRRSSPLTTNSSMSADGADDDDRRVRARGGDEYMAAMSAEDKRKGTWSPQEDELLRSLVVQHSAVSGGNSSKIRWSVVAQQVPGRVGKQCRERWLNHLAPSVKKTTWSNEEDQLLLESHRLYGNQWSKISKLLEGRPENSVKNRFYSLTSRVPPTTSSQHQQQQQQQQQYGESNNHRLTDGSSMPSLVELSFASSHDSSDTTINNSINGWLQGKSSTTSRNNNSNKHQTPSMQNSSRDHNNNRNRGSDGEEDEHDDDDEDWR